MPDTVIDQVHRLARRQNSNRTLTFTNCDNVPLGTLYADLEPDIDDHGGRQGVEEGRQGAANNAKGNAEGNAAKIMMAAQGDKGGG